MSDNDNMVTINISQGAIENAIVLLEAYERQQCNFTDECMIDELIEFRSVRQRLDRLGLWK